MINVNLSSILAGFNGVGRPHPGASGFSKASQHIPQIRGHADQAPGITNFTPSRAGGLLNEKMAAAAENVLPANAPQFQSDDGADDFSPEKIAQNILSFIDSAISLARASGDDPAAIEKKLADARAAIEKGFDEAKDILQSFGAWGGTVKENAEKTLDLIQKGFDDRAAIPPDQSSQAFQTTSLLAVEAKRAETFEMEITTREGDTVKLSYSTQQSTGFQAGQIVDNTGVQQALSAYSSESKNLTFSVQGDLNDDEKKAIADMMQGIEKLANEFFSGDMRGTMQHALALDMNTEQLSSMSLNLAYTESRSAIAAYQQVSALDQNKPTPESLNNAEIGTITNFNQRLENMLKEAEKFFQKSDELVKRLFRDIAPEAGPETVALRDMLQGMVAAATSRNEQGTAATAIS